MCLEPNNDTITKSFSWHPAGAGSDWEAVAHSIQPAEASRAGGHEPGAPPGPTGSSPAAALPGPAVHAAVGAASGFGPAAAVAH